jgi:GTPase SAR1 family protein
LNRYLPHILVPRVSQANGAAQAAPDQSSGKVARARCLAVWPHALQAKKWIRIKILSMGDAGTGKSCLIKRYCEDKVQQHSALARPNNDPA